MKYRVLFAVATLVIGVPTAARSQPLFSDNFDTTTASTWNVNISTNNPSGSAATFGFDYSALGIPSAPHSTGGTTVGVKLEANFSGAQTSGVTISPILGTPLPANYKLQFDLWENFNGPLDAQTSVASTQHSGGGIGTDGTTSQMPTISVQGVTFAADGDGGAAQSYRAYKGSTTQLTGSQGFAAPVDPVNGSDPRSHFNSYYGQFGNKTAPAAQTAMNSTTQTGTTQQGTQGFAWHTWEMTKNGNAVNWTIDGLPIANLDVTGQTFPGTNFFLGQFDFFGGSVVDPTLRPFLFGLFDNVQVTPVPEPSSLALVGLAAPVLLRLRRRRTA
jgi:hypothetical protein